MSTEIQVTPMTMLGAAMEKGIDAEQLDKLMSLQERWETSEAKKAFSAAMAQFQADLKPIHKKRTGYNDNTYADIDDIALAVRPMLSKAGLSYRFEQTQAEAMITVICIVTHQLGHSEQTEVTANADTSGGKNAIQAIASAVTYLRRYSLTGALGLTTGEDDNDGGKPEFTVEDLLEYYAVVREEFYSIYSLKNSLSEKEYSTAKESWMELDEQIQRVLWRAPSKGGIFTTEERAQMKSPEWIEA